MEENLKPQDAADETQPVPASQLTPLPAQPGVESEATVLYESRKPLPHPPQPPMYL